MERKLLKKSIVFVSATICLFLTGFNVNAQTLVIGTLPNPAQVGSSPVFNFTYSSTTSCALYAELRKFDFIDGQLVQNYDNSYISGGFSLALPAAADPTAATTTFTVPGGTPLSSSLPANKKYAWIFKLTPGVNNYSELPGTPYIYLAADIIASSVVVNSIAFTATPPPTVMVGTTQTLNISYTLAQVSNLKIGLSVYDNGGNYVSSGPAVVLNSVPVTTTTPVTTTVDVVLPADLPLTSSLGTNYYKWEYSYFTETWGYLGGIYTTDHVNVTENLAVTGFNGNKQSLLSQNPVQDVLRLNPSADYSFVTLYDLNGRTILKFSKNDASNGINVSGLSKGIYILATDTNEKVKFVKQ